MRLAVAGGGYVGLSTATGFARQGHVVDLVEIDAGRAQTLALGRLPFDEPSLARAFQDERRAGSINIHHGYESLSGNVDFAFICTSTPLTAQGFLDTAQVFQAAEMLTASLSGALRLVVRSTVNPGTTDRLQDMLGSPEGVQVLVNPEFLREGSALYDFEAPARVVVGGADHDAVDALGRLYDFAHVRTLRTNAVTAELIKLTSNAALAVRVSMANEIARIAAHTEADLDMVLEGVGSDPRIGQDYLNPGLGFGCSCLPKDLEALRAAAQSAGISLPVFDGASLTNDEVIEILADRIAGARPGAAQRIAVVGVGFKPGSDSLRNSQPVRLVRTLLARGASLTVFDPVAEQNARREFGERVAYAQDIYRLMESADTIVVVDKALFRGALNGHLPSAEGKVIIDAVGRQFCLTHSDKEMAYGRR